MTEIIERSKSRKLELEWSKERQLERERLLEGQTFKDKDAFVTSAYKKKLQERLLLQRELEEKDKKDASELKSEEFYLHLLKQSEPK